MGFLSTSNVNVAWLFHPLLTLTSFIYISKNKSVVKPESVPHQMPLPFKTVGSAATSPAPGNVGVSRSLRDPFELHSLRLDFAQVH